jgi:hypothetical protein
MENVVEIKITVKETFDSLYKLGYFLIDLNSICNFTERLNKQKIEDAKSIKKYTYGITSRFLNKDSLDTIKLISFSQGSFIALFIAPLIVGVILKIVDKYINQERDHNKISITINNPTIINVINNEYSEKRQLSDNIDCIVKKLKEENLLAQDSIIYDKNGKKILEKNVERLKGEIINENW